MSDDAIKELLNLTRRACSDAGSWRRGDNLMSLPLDNAIMLAMAQRVAEQRNLGLEMLTPVGKRIWGAAFFLVGSRALNDIPEGPFTYQAIWKRFKVSNTSPPTMQEYDAIEQGANFWGFPVLRNINDRRLFRATMLLHSGGGWVVLEEVAEQVARDMGWDGIAHGSREGIEAWLEKQRRLPYLTQAAKTVLEHQESRFTTVERLQQLAQTRSRILKEGLARGDLEHTLQAMTEAGHSVRGILEAPSEDSATRVLRHLLHFRNARSGSSITYGRPRWYWDTSNEAPRLMVELPGYIALPEIPPEVEMIEVAILGSGAFALYERANGQFGYSATSRALESSLYRPIEHSPSK